MNTSRNDSSDAETKSLPEFDRAMGQLHGLPDVVHTNEARIRIVPDFGIGTKTYLVQTFRQREVGDTIFLELYSDEDHVRLVIPAKVSAAIARQREQLTDKSRSKSAKAVAADRKQRGIQPAFLKNKKVGAK